MAGQAERFSGFTHRRLHPRRLVSTDACNWGQVRVRTCGVAVRRSDSKRGWPVKKTKTSSPAKAKSSPAKAKTAKPAARAPAARAATAKKPATVKQSAAKTAKPAAKAPAAKPEIGSAHV